jgi:hypothetical protein
MTHLLTNIPSGTGLYMQPEGSPRLGPIRFNAHQFTELPFEFPSFSVEAPGLPPRHKIDIRHLVGYYRKYVGTIDNAFFDEEKATEILFIADHKFHKDRSMKEFHEDYERKRKFEDNYGCDDCYPWACRCPEDNEVIDIPWASGPDPTLDPEDPDDTAFTPVRKFVNSLIRDLMRDEDVSATINERVETLGRLICEAKAEALARIQDRGQDMATQLEALNKKHQQLDKYMVDVRAIVKARR